MSVDPDAWRLIGDPVRSKIVVLLAQEQLCTCHLADALEAKQPLVSYHLKALREAGLVEAEPCGRFTYYRLRPEALETAADELRTLAAAARTALKRPC